MKVEVVGGCIKYPEDKFAGLQFDEIASWSCWKWKKRKLEWWWWWWCEKGEKKVEVLGRCIDGSKDKFGGLHLDDGNGE